MHFDGGVDNLARQSTRFGDERAHVATPIFEQKRTKARKNARIPIRVDVVQEEVQVRHSSFVGLITAPQHRRYSLVCPIASSSNVAIIRRVRCKSRSDAGWEYHARQRREVRYPLDQRPAIIRTQRLAEADS
jgi:hypothetical protein